MSDTICERRIAALPELNEETYTEWIWGLQSALRSGRVWHEIFATVPSTGQPPQMPDASINPTTHATYMENAIKACGWIADAAGYEHTNITERFESSSDALGMLNAIMKKYADKTAANRHQSLTKLTNIRKKSDESCEQFISRLKGIQKHNKLLRPITYTLENLDDEIATHALVQNLDAANAYTTNILSLPNFDFASVTEVMLKTEAIKANSIPFSRTAPISSANTVSEFDEANAAYSNIICYWCEQPGHAMVRCPEANAAKKTWQANRDKSGSSGWSNSNGSGGNANNGGGYRGKGNGGGRGNHNNNGGGGGRGGYRGSNQRGGRGGNQNQNQCNTQANASASNAVEFEFAGHASTTLSPESTPSDLWTVDSGASSSMTPRKDWVHSIVPERWGVKLADGSIIWSEGRGIVSFNPEGSSEPILFHRVLYVPNLSNNLLSTNQLTVNDGYELKAKGKTMQFIKDNKVLFTASVRENNIALADGETVSISSLAPLPSSSQAETADSAVDLKTWHRRMNHPGLERLKRMINSDIVKGFKVTNPTCTTVICEECDGCKLTRAPHTKHVERAKAPLERIFSDVHGPIQVQGRKGETYWVTFIDDHSRFAMVYTLRSKDQVFDAFTHYAQWAENQMNARIRSWDEEGIRKTIKYLRDDKGGEYTSHKLRNFCIEHGIDREHTIRDTPQQNGVAERMNCTLSEGITTMLATAQLPPSTWPLALNTLVRSINRLPSSAISFRTPFELWNGHIPSLDMLRSWGCEALVHLQKDQRVKPFGTHARRCVFIGYPPDYKGWLFIDLSTGKEVVSDSAVFYEDRFPGKLRDNEAKTNSKTSALVFMPDDNPVVNVLPPQPPAPPAPSAPPTRAPSPAYNNPPPNDPDEDNNPSAPAPRDPTPLPPTPTQIPRYVMRLPGVADRPIENVPQPQQPRLSREARALIDPRHNSSVTQPLPSRRTRALFPGQFNEDNIRKTTIQSSKPARDLLAVNTRKAGRTNAEHGQALPPPAASTSQSDQPNEVNLIEEAFTVQDIKENDYIPMTDIVEFAFATSSSLEPKSLAEAITRPDADKWIEAAISEIKAMIDNQTWELVPLPHGRKAIGSRWVFKIKRNSDGSIERYKGRIVAKGFLQKEGVDYSETFAPTVRLSAVRTVLVLAALEDMELESVDISTAFLNGDMEEEVFMKVPEGLGVDGETEGKGEWVVRLLKAIYGLKQAGRMWAKKLHQVLTSLDFARTECEHSFYIYEREGTKVFVPVYVDDLTIASNNKDAITKLKCDLTSHFKIRDLGPTEFILGIKIKRDRPNHTIYLSQSAYIQAILDDVLGTPGDWNSVQTPMMENAKLSRKGCAKTPEELEKAKSSRYGEIVGKLLYLTRCSRPDIAYAVGVLCRFMINPGPSHIAALKHLLRYLVGTVNLRLAYSPTDSVDLFSTYSDASLGGDEDEQKSTGGFAIMMGTGAIVWGSRLQHHTAMSSTESEYVNASHVGAEVMWMRYMMEELGYDISNPSPLFMDSNSAAQVVKNPEHQSSMKHVHRSYNWVRQKVESNDIRIMRVAGVDNVSDIFTKPLGKLKFCEFRSKLGLQ